MVWLVTGSDSKIRIINLDSEYPIVQRSRVEFRANVSCKDYGPNFAMMISH